MNIFKRNIHYDVWIYKDGDSYYTETYTNIFGKEKQRELNIWEIKHHWLIGTYFRPTWLCE